MHVLSEDAPIAALFFPSAHKVQDVEEVDELYLPAPQSMQKLVSAEPLDFPGGQASHSIRGNTGPLPGAHAHSARSSVEIPEMHTVQVLSELAPVVKLAFPASHAKQALEEVAEVVEL